MHCIRDFHKVNKNVKLNGVNNSITSLILIQIVQNKVH